MQEPVYEPGGANQHRLQTGITIAAPNDGQIPTGPRTLAPKFDPEYPASSARRNTTPSPLLGSLLPDSYPTVVRHAEPDTRARGVTFSHAGAEARTALAEPLFPLSLLVCPYGAEPLYRL